MGLHKGQTNNPNGPPNAWETFKAKFNKYGDMALGELQNIDLTAIKAKDAAVIKVIKEWLEKDNISAIKEWMNRSEGMPTQTVEQTNTNKEDIKISFE